MDTLLPFLSIALLVLPLTTVRASSTADFQVGVILDIHSSDSPVGPIGKRSLCMAQTDFYSVHSDYKSRLVLNFRDSNDSVVDAAGAVLDLMKDVQVDAIIGPQKSTQANFLMDLGDRAQVPIISFSATSPLFPRTPYFVQTAQSDANQVQSIASIVQAFQWNQVVVIYEDTVFGNGIIPYLCNALQDVNVRVSYRSVIPRSASDDFISDELHKMMTRQTRVFVVHMSQSLGTRFFLKAKGLGMMSEGYAWIVTSGMIDLFNLVDLDVVEAMQGVLGVKPLVPKSKKYQHFAARWIRMYFQNNQDIKLAETSVFGLWAYDTFWALAMAAETVADAMKNKAESIHSQGSFVLGKSETGPLLLQALLKTSFKGVAGEFELVNGQLEQTPYQIVNIVGKYEREVGIWTHSRGISSTGLNMNVSNYSTLKGNLRTIIWPGDSTVVPRGWEFPVSGQKLKIGVAQKPGFNEFLKVEKDPQTNATKVSGYYKEVFDSVMAALPYAISYEYSAYPFYNCDGSRAGSYDDLVYRVSLQEHYDAALGDITITANRSIYADFTLPFAEGGVASIVPIKYEDVNDLFTFLKPLTKELWLTTAVFYISTALAIWILGSRIIASSSDFPGQHAGMICYFPFFPGEGFQASLLCLVLVAWAFAASLLNSTYTASLASRLTVQRLIPTVTEVSQLIKNGDYVGCQEGSFLVSFLKNLGFQESKIKTYNSSENCNEALMLGSKNGGISAYYDVLPHIKMILSEYSGNYMMVGPTYRTAGFAFVFPKGFAAVSDISRAIIQLTEKGIIHENKQQSFDNSVCSNQESASSPSSVRLRSFFVLFLITGSVTLACLLVSYISLPENRAFLLQRMSLFRTQFVSIVRASHNFLKRKNPFTHHKTTNTRDQT